MEPDVKVPSLFRSGWWILVAAVAVSILVVVVFLRMPIEPSRSEGSAPIALEPSLIDGDELIHAMARDGLQALVNPGTITPNEIRLHNENERGKLLVSSDRVVGVELGGEARAYPLRLLRWHEAVNDTLGGRAVAVTYSPLSGGIAVWDRDHGGEILELAVSGRLLDSNTILYDRRPAGGSSSLWHQLTGEALTGPAVGARLDPLSASIQTWAGWIQAYPETTVMAPDPDSKRLYKRDPYHSYRGSQVLRFPVDPQPPEGSLALKDMVATVGFPGGDVSFAMPYLELAVGEAHGTWATMHDSEVYFIDFDTEAGTFSIVPRDEDIPAPPVRFGSWFQWYALDPGVAPLP